MIKNSIYIVLVLIALFIILLIFIKNMIWSNSNKDSNENNSDTNNSKEENKSNSDVDNSYNNTKYIYWTGGFDSTFRICNVLFNNQNVFVQPIYITMDNVDDDNKIHRQNKEKEIKAMDNIRSGINNHRLLDTLYIDHITPDKVFTDNVKNLHYKHRKFSRPITQYERCLRFSNTFKYPIDISVENCGTGIDDATKEYRIGKGDNCRIDMNLIDVVGNEKEYIVFHNVRFPIVHLTKQEMLDISNKEGYDHILKLTWSCWFPLKNGKPCGKCHMCQDRII